MPKQFAMTAKKTRQPITAEHYLDYLDYCTDLGKVGNVNFETTRGLHIHFILEVKDKLDFKKLKPTKYGWNVKAVPIYNPKGWNKYSRKDHRQNKTYNNLVKKYQLQDSDTEIEIDDMDGFIMPTKKLFT